MTAHVFLGKSWQCDSHSVEMKNHVLMSILQSPSIPPPLMLYALLLVGLIHRPTVARALTEFLSGA